MKPGRRLIEAGHGMKLTVLVDNSTLIDRYYEGEPGLSLLIEEDGLKILFDCGYSDLFLKNAWKMGLSLDDLDFVLLSHGHMDHTWGLEALTRRLCELRLEGRPCKRPALVAHPEAFTSIALDQCPEIGPLLEPEKLARHYDMRLGKAAQKISERLLFLGEIPRRIGFEQTEGIGFKEGQDTPDRIMDDSALVYRGSEGLVIITGCSHAGICNIVAQAMDLTGESRIADIIGGLHLLSPSRERLEGTVEYLRRIGPETLSPCHCTDLNSKIALAAVTPLREVGVGLEVSYL
ncbi:7,8-dihydropterin-6-yl-methyl-4-(beta-D-ribofuranosyl)aminobenzene 5'-phosphate synthase [Desulfomicrobium apsheronum]|uniref:7,8-dihydropterin-6-yl-methyl-4-(Beta-D-ribofuranosyl)aminobenzene 5'-phosphate synthase n=2 Tax=Desulfomicrobium apsheronum TaxID=52560 RepID=A0A1I3Z6S3_9BACT|nr:7,8-dihydropterin-6-yl-methyl-4-(beta-D-ribofuranosyl)aminobenzene 5'-phosphate synthase [Desulfomicrobium apsheronum]